MGFEKLLAELDSEAQEQETMRKALPADDGADEKKIRAAAAEGGMDGEIDPDIPFEDDEDEDEEEFIGKSLGMVTLESGEEVEALDGTELVKSLIGKIDSISAKNTETEGQMLKAMEKCLSLIQTQSDLIKSLQAEQNKLRGEGRGRKTVLNVSEKNVAGSQLAKSESAEMNADEFLAKSNSAFDAGKITGLDLTTIDVCLRQGTSIDPAIIQKVLS